MTTNATDDRTTRRQNLAVVTTAREHAVMVTDEWIADTIAELEEADEARDRIAELEIRVQELTEELHDAAGSYRRACDIITELRARDETATRVIENLTEELRDVTESRDSWARQCAAHKRNIERLQNERDSANVAPRGGW